jgi:hypothetical protein
LALWHSASSEIILFHILLKYWVSLCLVSLCWVSLCWVSWRVDSASGNLTNFFFMKTLSLNDLSCQSQICYKVLRVFNFIKVFDDFKSFVPNLDYTHFFLSLLSLSLSHSLSLSLPLHISLFFLILLLAIYLFLNLLWLVIYIHNTSFSS